MYIVHYTYILYNNLCDPIYKKKISMQLTPNMIRKFQALQIFYSAFF